MKYDFDKVINRRNTDSLKWDILKDNELPMWVADMDFEAAPAIRKALADRLEKGVFGYNMIPDAWYDAYSAWWQRRHGLAIKKENLIFSTGVIPSLSSIVRKMTTVGENVLIQTPVYNIFYNSILNNGRHILENELVYENGAYAIDFDDLEAKLSDTQTTMMILCNPHNPIGKIWSREELERIAALCAKHHVLVVSDEIHCDITEPGKGYIPFAAVSDTAKYNSITLMAPTKCFNIAGLQTSAIAVFDRNLYNKVNRGLNTDECAEPNSFAVCAAIAAFNEGEEWLDALNEYIAQNRKTVETFIAEKLPQLHLVPSEATYLLWLDCRRLGIPSDDLSRRIRQKTGLFLSSGSAYGKSGDGFLRMNIACPRQMLLQGLQRLQESIWAL